MQRYSPLLRGTLILTAFSLILRLLGLWFQSRITGFLGAEGVGLLSLGMNVQGLAITLGTSGIHYSVTRLLSEELGRNRPANIRSVMRSACIYAGAFSLLASGLLFVFAPSLATFAGDKRLTLSLRCFSFGLTPLALSSVFSGYFTASLRPWKAGLSQLTEQLAMMLLTVLLLPRIPDGRTDLRCALVSLSGAAADLLSLLLSYILYRYAVRALPRRSVPTTRTLGRLIRLSLPLAFSSYARTALSSLQHLLVPKALRRSGYGAGDALAVYGTVSGMVFPVLGFASVFFGALSEMLIPGLTEAQVRGDRKGMERIGGRILSACLLFSSLVSLLLYLLGPWLGLRLYRSAEAGEYIRVLAPLTTIMYLDSVVDGMLKGLGLQLSSMLVNLTDAALTLAGVCLLLPRFGVTAYIGILYGSECFNFLLSFLRLRKSLTIRFL